MAALDLVAGSSSSGVSRALGSGADSDKDSGKDSG